MKEKIANLIIGKCNKIIENEQTKKNILEAKRKTFEKYLSKETADEMFKKLGYKRDYFYEKQMAREVKMKRYVKGDEQISFGDSRKEVWLIDKQLLSVGEIDAISKQIEELGWNNENN